MSTNFLLDNAEARISSTLTNKAIAKLVGMLGGSGSVGDSYQ
jgi:hypothetical protein